jgi:hypothetical protein
MTPIPPKKYPTIATVASVTYLIKAGLIRNQSRPVFVERRARVAVPIHAKVNAPLLFYKGEGVRRNANFGHLYLTPFLPSPLFCIVVVSVVCDLEGEVLYNTK